MLHVWGPAGCTLADLPRLIDEHKPDAIVVDPLRAILPSTWGGESINWDADTEATTKVCGMIRNASKGSGADLHLVHHPRKAGDSYGGNVAWLASVDCMVRLDPKGKPCASRWRSNARGRRWRRSMS
jgi:hypothetical protein